MTLGWQIPFILISLLVIFVLWIRKGIDETPSFKKNKESGNVSKIPIADTLRFHWREVLVAIGAKVVETAPFYIFGTFIVFYGTSYLNFCEISVLYSVMFVTIVTMI